MYVEFGAVVFALDVGGEGPPARARQMSPVGSARTPSTSRRVSITGSRPSRLAAVATARCCRVAGSSMKQANERPSNAWACASGS
jgi:hypothetical protein